VAKLHLERSSFKQGTFVIVEGNEPADRFYIILSGKVHIEKETSSLIKERDTLGVGDFFGVISMLSSHGNIENVQALEDVSIVSVHKDHYEVFIANNSKASMKIITYFSQQMRYLDEALAVRTFKQKVNDDVSHLFDVAEYYVTQNLFEQAYFVFGQYIKHCPDGEKLAAAKTQMTQIALKVETGKQDYKVEGMNRIYSQNTMFFSESEPGDELYVIQKGSVKITKIINKTEVLLAVLKPGDIFGEMALLESKPRTANAIAYEECVVMAVNRENFQQMAAINPKMITRLTILLAERIWLIYKQLTSTLLTEPLARMYDMLVIQLEKNRIPDTAKPYTFDFGPKELIKMAALEEAEGNEVISTMLANKAIKIQDDKICCTHVHEIFSESASQWMLQKRKQSLKKKHS
jgi:CRP-like cAMP-binding protein